MGLNWEDFGFLMEVVGVGICGASSGYAEG